jgi:hypothetical protein
VQGKAAVTNDGHDTQPEGRQASQPQQQPAMAPASPSHAALKSLTTSAPVLGEGLGFVGRQEREVWLVVCVHARHQLDVRAPLISQVAVPSISGGTAQSVEQAMAVVCWRHGVKGSVR